MATVINTTFKFKRAVAARWVELNPILSAGEPGFEYDTKKLKIGDGKTAGVVNCIYKVGDEKALYQWNTMEAKYEPLSNGEGFDPSKINLINGGNANG